MKKFINQLASDKIILGGSVISTIFWLISVLTVALFYHRLPPYIPLFHQVSWGMARLGNKGEFFLPSLYVVFMMGINLLLSSSVYGKMPLVARIIAITNVLLSFILFLFTIRTLQLIL